MRVEETAGSIKANKKLDCGGRLRSDPVGFDRQRSHQDNGGEHAKGC